MLEKVLGVMFDLRRDTSGERNSANEGEGLHVEACSWTIKSEGLEMEMTFAERVTWKTLQKGKKDYTLILYIDRRHTMTPNHS